MKKRTKTIVLASLFSIIGTGIIVFQPLSLVNEFEHSDFDKQTKTANALKLFEKDLLNFQSLLEESLVWRHSAIKAVDRLKLKAESGVVLDSNDLKYLHEGVEIYIKIREPLLALAHKHKNMADASFPIEYKPGAGTQIFYTDKSHTWVKSVVVDPTDVLGDMLIKQFKLSLAAALVLYDNFLIAILPYSENSKLRQIINFDNTKFVNSLESVTKNYLDEKYRRYVHLAAKRMMIDKKWRDKSPKVKGVNAHDYLGAFILSSITFSKSKYKSWVSTTAPTVTNWVNQYLDAFSIFQDESTNIVSQVFGDSVGLIETRKGKLYGKGEKFEAELESSLQPLDILLEKTPFRLTDKLIPGYYGHVAIWLGSESQLKREKLWNLPFIKPFHQKIRDGYTVLEALRSGVQLSKLSHFINVDDLAIVRFKKIEHDQKKNSVKLAIDQIGKGYDFNFDVETDKRIICSELVYVVFPQIKWQVEKSVGRYTISPDNIALYALKEENEIHFHRLYANGSRVIENLKSVFQRKIQGD